MKSSVTTTLLKSPATGTSADLGPAILAIQQEYERETTTTERKRKGQCFTPPEACRFMAGLLSLNEPDHFRLLDPRAGLESLPVAVCERVCDLQRPRHLEIHLFENDPMTLPFLKRNMELCRGALEERGHLLYYEIHSADFILDSAAASFGAPSLFRNSRHN